MHTSRARLMLFAVLLALTMGASSLASAQLAGIPISGTFADAKNGGTGHFTGTFNLNHFTLFNGKVYAVGNVVGSAVGSTGALIGSGAAGQVMLPLSTPTGSSCTILHLILGPINLNLLGLQVTTNQIVLDITAVPGPGNLLGNLLCSIANLLNGGSPSLSTLVLLLNKLLGVLGSL